MTTAAEKTSGAEPAAPTAAVAEKHPDKRKALGRGLDSLLPAGPPREVRSTWANRGGISSVGSGPVAFSIPAGGSPDGHLSGAHPPDAHPGAPGPHSTVIAELHAQASRPAGSETVLQIPLASIDGNPYQTRVEFDEEALEELRESIRATGVVSPIVVRPAAEGRYVLVLGERRCRASKMAGKTTIPAIVRRISDQDAAEMTVVENLQRQDLNCMEQAAAFVKLSQGFGLTQAQIGERVGMSRESISNYMRLMKLPGTVMQYLMHGTLRFSEARELLKLEDNALIEKVAKDVVEKQMSFLKLQDLIEEMVFNIKVPLERQPEVRGARWVDPNVRAAQNELQRTLGLKVKISDRKGRGKIVIEYASVDDYDRVVGMLRGNA